MKLRNQFRTLFLSGLFVFLFSSLSYGQSDRIVAQVKEKITKTERVLTFQNVYGKDAKDIAFFEDKVNKAKMRGVISVDINPTTGLFTARLSKAIKKEELDHFFQAVGFKGYTIK